VRLIAAGKAAGGMAAAAAQALGPRLDAGLAIVPVVDREIRGIDIVTGGHPVPTAASEAAGRRALALATSMAADQQLLVLLSGGASALMAVPVAPITLEDKQRTTEQLLREGADIYALNTVRKHLSAIKGGKLAAAAPAACRTLVISDVVGEDLSVIGSGPTIRDESTFREAYDALRRFGGLEAYPARVSAHLKRGMDGDLVEAVTPEPGPARNDAAIIGSRKTAMTGAAEEARRRGFHAIVIDAPVVGEAREAADSYARDIRARAAAPGRPLCIISSGETTVHVKGPGTGGRNQELALALAGMPGLSAALPPDQVWALASVGTDGIDGPTDAAGAVLDATTAGRAERANLAPREFLNDNNAYAFFSALGDLIHTGPTGTNVGDVQIFLLA
jgi:glycerate 2-kinase